MPRILLIDDDKAVREATQIVLRANGYDVVMAHSGPAGIDLIRQNGVDLVILDVFMPGMDGLMTAQAIRRTHPNLPIVVVSGFMFGGECPDMPGFDAMAAEAGAMFALYKPFKPAQLIQTIKKALNVLA
jgi:CheY-like chemotaxis protein